MIQSWWLFLCLTDIVESKAARCFFDESLIRSIYDLEKLTGRGRQTKIKLDIDPPPYGRCCYNRFDPVCHTSWLQLKLFGSSAQTVATNRSRYTMSLSPEIWALPQIRLWLTIVRVYKLYLLTYLKWPTPFEKRCHHPTSAYIVSTVKASEKCSIANRKSTMRAVDEVRTLPLTHPNSGSKRLIE